MKTPADATGTTTPALTEPMPDFAARFKPVHLRLPKPSSSRKRLRRRQLLIGLVILPAIVIAGTTLTVREFLEPEYLADQLSETLESMLAVGVTIGELEYSFPSSIIARDLVVASPEGSNLPELLKIPVIKGRLRLSSLLSGRIELHRVTIDQAEIFIELDDGVCTLVRAFPPLTTESTAEPLDVFPGLQWTPPSVTLHDVLVHCCPLTVLETEPLRVDSLSLEYEDVEQRRFRITGRAKDASVDRIGLEGTGSFKTADLDATLTIEGLELDAALRDRLTTSSLVQLWDQYQPRGSARLVHHFLLSGGVIEKNSARITLEGGGVRMVDPKVAIDDVSGVIEITPSSVRTVEPLVGSAFSGSATVHGHFDLHPKGPGGGSLQLVLDDLLLEPSVADALPQRLREEWDKYEPHGTARLEVVAEGDSFPPDLTETRLYFTDVDVAYHDYPYPLESLSGSIVLTGAGDISVSLNSPVGSAPRVRIESNAKSEPGMPMSVIVDIQDLTIDQTVSDALHPPDVKKIYDEYSPSGLVDLKVWVIREKKGERQHVDVKVTARGATVRHIAYPLPIEGVTGSVLILRDRVELREFHGKHGDSDIYLHHGDVVFGDEGFVDVTIESPELTVDAAVIRALPDESEEAIRAFGLGGDEPNGSVGLSVLLKARGNDPLELEVNATIIDPVRMKYEEFPYPLEFHAGRFLYYSELRGVAIDGLRTDDELSPIITISGDHSRPDAEDLERRELFLKIDIAPGNENRGLDLSEKELVDSLPADLKLFSEKMELEGLLTATVEVRQNVGGSKPETVSYSGDLEITDGSIDFGLKLEQINGAFDVFGEVGPDEPHHFSAHFKNGSYRFTRFLVEVPNELNLVYGAVHPEILQRRKLIRLDQPEIEGYLPTLNLISDFPEKVEQVFQASIGPATMFGGALNGFFYVDLAENGHFKGEAECKGLDLSKGSMDIFRTPDIAGIANGRVDVGGLTKDAASMVGLGFVTVTAARLSRVPALAAVFLNPLKALSRENQNFHKAEAEFRIHDELFDMRKPGYLKLESEVVEVIGSGTLDFENYLDLTLEPQTLGGLPILSDILNSLTRFKMRGKLDDPEIFGEPE